MQDIEKVFRALILKKDYMIETKIKKLYKDSKLPSQKSPEDAGYDLYVHRVEDKGSYLKVYSGIALQPEIGKFFMLAPRSSSFKKGLTLYNNLGIIDQNYTGEVVAIMYKTFDYISEPKVGDRLVQLVPQQQYKLNIVEVDDFEQTDRNANGFGSSGD
jgi:dUTP pyrophosphatase